MKTQIFILMLMLPGISGCAQNEANESGHPFYRTLTPEEERIIIDKGTERAFTGLYDKFYEAGIYVCKRCGAEVVQVLYNSSETGYDELAKLFFEIHDPTQKNRQGPDVGNQYRSEIFYRSVEQMEIAKKLVSVLENKGFKVVTRISPVSSFWKAEDYHQDYYKRKGGTPYCHKRVERFS